MSELAPTDPKSVARSVRGPSYPTMGLEDAIMRATQFWQYEKRSAAPVEAAATHWGYKKTSSSWKGILAALIHFGLMDEAGGSGDSRMVKLSGRALDIILDSIESPKRAVAIQEAARSPKLYAELLAKWSPQELPSDHSMRFFLLRDKGFNEASLPGFLKDFRATLEFANLKNTPTIPESEVEKLSVKPENSASLSPVIEKDVLMDSVQSAAPNVALVARQLTAVQVGFKQDTFSLDEGQVVLQFPEKMSSDSYEDFQSWIELQLRKIKRSIQT